MENSNVVLEDIKNLRRNVKSLTETAERLSGSVFLIRQLAMKERDQKKKKEYKDVIEEIDFQLHKCESQIDDFRDSDLFRNKIEIPKHTK